MEWRSRRRTVDAEQIHPRTNRESLAVVLQLNRGTENSTPEMELASRPRHLQNYIPKVQDDLIYAITLPKCGNGVVRALHSGVNDEGKGWPDV